MLPEPFERPRCGNCGAYFNPGEVICAACGAHRYSDAPAVMGPQARPVSALQRYFWWALAGGGLIVCSVLGVVFGLFGALLHLLPH